MSPHTGGHAGWVTDSHQRQWAGDPSVIQPEAAQEKAVVPDALVVFRPDPLTQAGTLAPFFGDVPVADAAIAPGRFRGQRIANG